MLPKYLSPTLYMITFEGTAKKGDLASHKRQFVVLTQRKRRLFAPHPFSFSLHAGSITTT